MEVFGITDADARGSEAIYKDGQIVGRATSGGYGWRCKKSLVLGLVKSELTDIGTNLEIEILGERYKARVIEESPFDPTNNCLMS
jgi:dimethylglycine dehydrogenase